MIEGQKVMLSVPDMSCEHCVKTINETLSVLPGVKTVLTDLPTKTVHVQYDPDQVTLKQVEATLDDAGYPVSHTV